MDRHTTLLLVACVLGAALVAWTWTEGGRARLLETTARRTNLAVPAAPRLLARRLQQRRTAGVLGGVVGLSAAALVLPPTTSSEAAPSVTVPLVLGAGFVGVALAAAGHAVLISRRPVAVDAPRVARGRDVVLRDYVNAFERRSMVVVSALPALVGLMAVVLVLGGLIDAPPVRPGLLVACGVVPLAVLAGAHGLFRLVLAAPQPAGSTEDLAWDDALRSMALRDVLSVPLYAGLIASVLAAVELSTSLPPALAPGATGLLVLGSLVALAVVLGLSVAGRPARHFRDELWPLEQAGARP